MDNLKTPYQHLHDAFGKCNDLLRDISKECHQKQRELAALRRVAEAAERVTELSEVFDHPAFKGRGFQTLDAALAELKKVRDGEKGDGE